MNKLLLLLPLLFSSFAFAQFSVQDSVDGKTRMKILGKEWTPSVFSLAVRETDKMNDDGGRLSTYNYVKFATYLPNSMRLSFAVPWQYNSAGTDRFNGGKMNKSETFLQDLLIAVQDYDPFMLPWDMGSYWEGKIYLPTSKNSKKAGTIGAFRNQLNVAKKANRWLEFEAESKIKFFWQSNSTYKNSFEDEDGFEVNVVSSTKQNEFEHNLRMWAKPTPETGVGITFQMAEEYWYKSAPDIENKSKPGLKTMSIGPQVRFPIKVNRDENRSEFGQFKAKNSEFVLLSFISL
jgi:hypothetical protein